MPSDDTKPIRKRFAPEPLSSSAEAINLALARDVLRRVREGEIPATEERDGGHTP